MLINKDKELLGRHDFAISEDPGEFNKKLEEGIYESTLNSGWLLEECLVAESYIQAHEFGEATKWQRSTYGVADDIEQVKVYFKPEIELPDRFFVILTTPVYRSEQPEFGGWRYYKWGPYIGKQRPNHEYLYDETHINRVLLFHLLEVKREQPLLQSGANVQ